MKLNVAFIILSVGLVCFTIGVEGSECKLLCDKVDAPVCGTLTLNDGSQIQCTFGNVCEFEGHQCLWKQNWSPIWHQTGTEKCKQEDQRCKAIMSEAIRRSKLNS